MELAAMLNPDTPGEAFFQVHPMHHTEALLGEMLDMAETNLPSAKENGRRELITWVNEKDALHKDLLTRRGYARSRYKAEHMRRRFLTRPIENRLPRAGTQFDALGDESELPARGPGSRGKPSIPKNPMRNTRAGSGIRMFSPSRYIGATLTLSRWRLAESWLHSAPSGCTM